SASRNATSLGLEPLTDEEARELVAALLPAANRETAVSLIAERSEGNPLFAEEMVQRLAEEGEGEELPDTVQGVLAARLDSLPPFERRLVQHAAVSGRTFWPGSLASLAQEEGADLADALRALQDKALDLLEAAGDAASALYSNAEAFDHYEAACALDGADASARARVREKQGDVALLLGRVDAAVAAWEECLEFQRRQEDLPRLGDLNRKLAAALWQKGELRAAIERYQRGIGVLKDGPPTRELVRLYEEAATLYMHTGDNMLAIYAAEKALRLAERLEESAAASRAHEVFGRVFGRTGDSAKARENLERS